MSSANFSRADDVGGPGNRDGETEGALDELGKHRNGGGRNDGDVESPPEIFNHHFMMTGMIMTACILHCLKILSFYVEGKSAEQGGLLEVIVFFDRFFDVPDAGKALREGDVVAFLDFNIPVVGLYDDTAV